MAAQPQQPPPERQCTSLRTDGMPCRNWALRYQPVCANHGADTPSTRRATTRAIRQAIQRRRADRRTNPATRRITLPSTPLTGALRPLSTPHPALNPAQTPPATDNTSPRSEHQEMTHAAVTNATEVDTHHFKGRHHIESSYPDDMVSP